MPAEQFKNAENITLLVFLNCSENRRARSVFKTGGNQRADPVKKHLIFNIRCVIVINCATDVLHDKSHKFIILSYRRNRFYEHIIVGFNRITRGPAYDKSFQAL